MSHRRASVRGHSKANPRGHGRTGSSLDGRLAYDIVEAAWVIRAEKAREAQAAREEKRRAKIVPITLAKAPWEQE